MTYLGKLFSLEGHTALVTGARTGLGRAVATDNTEALRADERRNSEILSRIPAGRRGTPDDLAGAAVFLAGPASDYVTGHVLAVDGGWLAR